MFLLYSIHPKTLNITPRGIYQNSDEATEALQQHVQKYLTTYKGQQNLFYINHKQEILDHSNPNQKYFLKISSKYSNKITIYEKKEVTKPGYIYNAVYEVQKHIAFSLTEFTVPNEETRTNNTIANKSIQQNNKYQLIKETINASNTAQMTHGTHVKYISELKEVLSARSQNQF